MTPTQLDHLKLILAHLDNLLETASKRTPGEWTINKDRDSETYSVEADDTVCDFFYTSEETHHRHPFQEGSEENNATFITSCAGNAEAGWWSTKAAITQIEAMRKDTPCWRFIGKPLMNSILAAWPIEKLN